MKSAFKKDLEKEGLLSVYLNSCYDKRLRHYTYQRIPDIEQQLQGIDLYFKNKRTGKAYAVDEKAQLDYINEDLPTFAFELSYLKNGNEKIGWFLDQRKKTEFYALITAIFLDEQEYSSCKITLVNRKKLLQKLAGVGLDLDHLKSYRATASHGRRRLQQLDPRKEGYLFFSSKNKVEQPLNLILKLDWMIENNIAKRLL